MSKHFGYINMLALNPPNMNFLKGENSPTAKNSLKGNLS